MKVYFTTYREVIVMGITKNIAIATTVAASTLVGAVQQAYSAMITPEDVIAAYDSNFSNPNVGPSNTNTFYTNDASVGGNPIQDGYVLLVMSPDEKDNGDGQVGELPFSSSYFSGFTFRDESATVGAPGNGTLEIWAVPDQGAGNVTADEIFKADQTFTYNGVVSDSGDLGSLTFQPIPEPAAVALLGVGALAMGYKRRKE